MTQLSEWQMKLVLEKALGTGADFAELYFENRLEQTARLSNQVVQGVTDINIYGVGLTVLKDNRRVHVYSNQTDADALTALAGKAAGMIGAELQLENRFIPDLQMRPVENPNRFVVHPSSVSRRKKIRLLEVSGRAASQTDAALDWFAADYFDTDQQITIANSDGLLTGEQRISSRIRLQLAMESDGKTFFNWEDLTRPQGFETFSPEGIVPDFTRDVVARTKAMLQAGSAPSCTVPVVLEAGSCGTLWHECCGHALEASAIASRQSAFVDRIGEKIATDKVTLVDDGSIPGLYGSSAIDDEGRLRQKNVLIEKGVLRQYMCDRYHGRLIGQASNGCGRRQNYTYAVTSRMSNTYLAAGTDDNDEMIRSVPEGLFVTQIGGGTGGMQFSLEVKAGYWIKNGQLDRPVRGLVLTGNGLDIMKRIDRVGNRLVQETGGSFCGASSGLIPTTSSQPRVRISEMAIGGED